MFESVNGGVSRHMFFVFFLAFCLVFACFLIAKLRPKFIPPSAPKNLFYKTENTSQLRRARETTHGASTHSKWLSNPPS